MPDACTMRLGLAPRIHSVYTATVNRVTDLNYTAATFYSLLFINRDVSVTSRTYFFF